MEKRSVKRLLFVLNDLKIGGAESQVVRLLNGLCDKDYIITLALLWKRGELFERLDTRIKVVSLGFDRGKLYSYKRLKSLFRKFRPHVVNARLFYASVVTRLALGNEDVPILMTHGSLDRWRNSTINIFDRFLSERTDLFIVNSPAVSDMLKTDLKIEEDRITNIYNGIECSDFPENDFKGGVFGFLGRDSRAKGYDRFLKFVGRTHNDYRIYVAGEENVPEGIDENKIVFNSTDIDSFFKEIDILVVPSRWEGMPNVILEAGVYGKVVFASSGIGIEKIFGNSIEYFKNKKELDKLVDSYKDNPFLAMKKGQELWEKVNKDFSVEKMVEKYDRIYREAIRMFDERT